MAAISSAFTADARGSAIWRMRIVRSTKLFSSPSIFKVEKTRRARRIGAPCRRHCGLCLLGKPRLDGAHRTHTEVLHRPALDLDFVSALGIDAFDAKRLRAADADQDAHVVGARVAARVEDHQALVARMPQQQLLVPPRP